VEVLGKDNVVLGSDFPFDMGLGDPEDAMNRAISDGVVREKIAGNTAARLLSITG